MKVLLLIGATERVTDGNYLRLHNALLARGHEVRLGHTSGLGLSANRVTAPTSQPVTPLLDGEPFGAFEHREIEDFDLIWVLALGLQHNFLDTVQLLFNLETRTRVINSTQALMYLKSKYLLADHPEVFHYPETHAGMDPAELFAIMQREGGRWIAKPPAGSLGRDVYLLTSDDPNARVILDTMTGHGAGNYCLLQRWVPEIASGEKRVLLAGGKPVAQYLRHAQSDHRTNVLAGAHAEPCELADEERAYCEQIGHFLVGMGANYVGLDLAFPWVIEFNVINPGGLSTLWDLEGLDYADAILDALEISA